MGSGVCMSGAGGVCPSSAGMEQGGGVTLLWATCWGKGNGLSH